MKRSFAAFTGILLLGAPALLYAQGLGIKGGLSYGNVSNNGALPGDAKERTGFAIGLGMSTGGAVGFGVEGLYAQRGTTSDVAGDSRELDYIDVPAYVRIALPIPVLSPFAYAGPQASFELKCGSGDADCPSGRAKTTYAGVIGAGVKVFGLSIEGRYVYGLSDLKLNTVTTSSNYKTRSFLLLAGIGF